MVLLFLLELIQIPVRTFLYIISGGLSMRTMETLDTNYWIEYFARNKKNRTEPDWQAPLEVPDEARRALTQSIREFQLGDGGGPASLIAFNADTFRDRRHVAAEALSRSGD
jgi:hypothetical protein